MVVHVKNSLASGTTVHFHGITQNHSNWADGPSGVTQCPIPPGVTFTYQFSPSDEHQYGTYVSSRSRLSAAPAALTDRHSIRTTFSGTTPIAERPTSTASPVQ